MTPKCKKCGYCCKYINMQLPINLNIIDWFNKHGGIDILYDKKANTMTVRIPYKCAQLSEDNLCKLHGKSTKPYLCKTGPVTTQEYYVSEQCGYRSAK